MTASDNDWPASDEHERTSDGRLKKIFWRCSVDERIKIAMNTTGRKTIRATGTAGKSVKAVSSKATNAGAPTFEQIAKRSYEIYLARGAQPGHEVEDWLSAEAELSGKLLS